MAETWTVNGVDLHSLAWRIEKGDGLVGTAALLDLDVQIPARHGVLAANRRQYGPSELVLNMWVMGVDPTTGLIPGGSTDVDEYYKRVDTLSRLFHQPTLTVVHTRPDSTVRGFVGHLTSSIDFTREVSSPLFGRFSVSIRNPGCFWADTSTTTQSLSLTTGASGTLSSFAAATAPMSDLTVVFTALSNPVLIQVSTGVLIAYDAVIPAGKQLAINADTLAVSSGTGPTWSPDKTRVRFQGSRGFELIPEASGGPVVSLTHTGGGSGSVTVSGFRKYLVG